VSRLKEGSWQQSAPISINNQRQAVHSQNLQYPIVIHQSHAVVLKVALQQWKLWSTCVPVYSGGPCGRRTAQRRHLKSSISENR